jgi:hypothetical protein
MEVGIRTEAGSSPIDQHMYGWDGRPLTLHTESGICLVLEVGFEAGFSATALPLSRATPPVSDDARRVAWLRQQVAPTIARLADSGLMAEVYDALRLPFPPDLEVPREHAAK